ncbi:hypothetical protein JCM33374_g3490 [Metschnikowia sp. JCM 33374]|nr:hypothetical protein JCM33374_g3490 [Metschnikowia sp. JCM 33374]
MPAIDRADFVQVEGDQQSLKFADPKQQGKFELGVCMAIYKWDDLETAVENSWGGPKSADKRDWISGVVIDLFDEKAVDILLIEETLLYAMVDEFDVEVDTDSALEVGDLVIKIYRECAMHNYARVDEMYQRFLIRQQNRPQHKKVIVATDPNNPSSDEDDDDEDGESESSESPAPMLVDDDAMDIDDGAADNHHGPRQPIIDEDGFELVQRRGRRR